MPATAASAWTDLGGGIRVRQSRAYRMNSALLLHREHAIVVDPGVLPSELDDLKRATDAARPAAVTLFLTHAHWDHVLGRPWWPGARVLAHDAFAAEIARERAEIGAEAARLAAEHGESWSAPFAPFAPDEAVSGMRFAKLGPWRVVFRDAFGHCDSQLTLHLPEARLLFAADMLSDVEIPWLNRAPADYRATLEALRPLAEHDAIETLVPGHGAIAHGAGAVLGRLRRDLEYLDALESGVRGALREKRPLEETQQALAGIEAADRGESDSTAAIHRENVAVAYRTLAAPARPGPRPRTR